MYDILLYLCFTFFYTLLYYLFVLFELNSQNERPEEIKGSIEVVKEVRKTETSKKIETKLTTAEQNREKEIQRKLELIKRNVCILANTSSLLFSLNCLIFVTRKFSKPYTYCMLFISGTSGRTCSSK